MSGLLDLQGMQRSESYVRAHNDFRVVGIKESLKDSAALVLTNICQKNSIFF